MNYLRRALILSLLIHLVIGLGLQLTPADWVMSHFDNHQAVDIEIVDASKFKQTFEQVVRQADAPEEQKDDDEKAKARFLSEKKQRVVQETKARDVGLTGNRSNLPRKSWLHQLPPQPAPMPPGTKEAIRKMDGYEPIPMPKPSEMGSERAFENAPSTVGEVLPKDVALGNFTALNTDRFKYYSFYSRIEELVRFRWEQFLRNAVERFDAQYINNVITQRNWVTQVEFILTADGHFHSAKIYKESGVRYFDLAAVNSFREAGYFPNPPRDLIGDDGHIHIQYSFNVHWTPAALAGLRD